MRGAEIQFRFSSPLHDAIEEQKGQKFLQMKALTADAIGLDKNAAAVVDVIPAFRDALNGIQTPAKWMRSEVAVKEMQDIQAQQDEAGKLLATLQGGADVAKTASEAAMNMAPA